ncbi:MAG: serine/threonine protein kinase [Planctomycetaceae bacterium]|nr:serine/threonine protein kinase [Planctomycetaceae bacterium]
MSNRNSRVDSQPLSEVQRRAFLAGAITAPWLFRSVSASAASNVARDSVPNRFFFTSQGKTALVTLKAAGADPEIRYLELDAPGQATWQPGAVFPDGRHVVLLSMEPRRDGPGKPFDEYYTQTPTHIWRYDLETGGLEELCNEERIAPFETPALLIGNERILVQVVKDRVGSIVSMNLDGTDPQPFTKPGEGLPYGLSLSPDGRRVAYHLASPEGYQIWTSDADGSNRVRVAANPAHLFFGTSWSPDARWILYVDCHYHTDPGHDWCDVCVGRSNGSEHRVLTKGQSMWFAATYGDLKTRGGGSNLPAWTTDAKILYPQRLPDSRVAWQYRTGKADLDHFNRDYKPDQAEGGTEISLLDPQSGKETSLTPSGRPVWNFRANQSADGRQIVFCRAAVGEAPAVWVMNSDGSDARMITRGIDNLGADHPRWLPSIKAG